VRVDRQGETGVVVAERFGQRLDVHPVVQTGRERFTNRVEYLKLRNGEMGALVLLGAPLPLPQLHQTVTRRHRS
jgi:hypothetical protein